MKDEMNSMQGISRACDILFNKISDEKDLERFGLSEQSFRIAQSLFPRQMWCAENKKSFSECTDSRYINQKDLGVPNEELSLTFDPTDKEYRKTIDEVKNFFEKLDFNILPIKSESIKDDICGYRISTANRHWDYKYFTFSDARVSDFLKEETLATCVRALKNYPNDFTREDFKQIEKLLLNYGEQKEAKKIDLCYKSREYDNQKDKDFINVYQIQYDYLDGYCDGDNFSDSKYEYTWHIEGKEYGSVYDRLFNEGTIVIAYTDKETGKTSGTCLSMTEFMAFEEKDFKSFINEAIFYDEALREEDEIIRD